MHTFSQLSVRQESVEGMESCACVQDKDTDLLFLNVLMGMDHLGNVRDNSVLFFFFRSCQFLVSVIALHCFKYIASH